MGLSYRYKIIHEREDEAISRLNESFFCAKKKIGGGEATRTQCPKNRGNIILRQLHLSVFGTDAPPLTSIFQEPYSLFQPLFSRLLCSFLSAGTSDDSGSYQVGQHASGPE